MVFLWKKSQFLWKFVSEFGYNTEGDIVCLTI